MDASRKEKVLSKARREQKIATRHIGICEERFFVSNAALRRSFVFIEVA
jgi:hypothetical protein